ncbi:phosphatase 2C-like domain-containing protein [Mycena sp. CBHHK59/15]|nr:phosphatase 2C-like domain-containing protein [Mycena sp. CBHHK59/15]
MLWPLLARRRIKFPAGRHYSSLQRPYTFYIAANWAGKPSYDDDPAPKVFFPPDSPIGSWRDTSLAKFAPYSTRKVRSPGEDFFLCTSVSGFGVRIGVSLGIADGVGGWTNEGIDPSLFSQALMYYAHGHLQNGWAGEREVDPILEIAAAGGAEITPSECLQFAYQNVLAEKAVPAGSSTACLLTLNASSGILRSANLGDSGFFVIRSSSIFYNSPPLTYYFNCPWQLAKLPPTRGRNSKYRGSIRDPPSAAHEYTTRLRDGDIIIVYTDGLSDNVYPLEILKMCSLIMQGPGPEAKQVQSIAENLVRLARACMFSDRVSPFELEAKQHRKVYTGGVSGSNLGP